jgi:hypothetical protein
MISLHIKGNMNAALFGASKNGVELTAIQCRYRSGIAECFASAHDEFLRDVQEWYADDAELIDGYGYPAGTLLFFARDERNAA